MRAYLLAWSGRIDPDGNEYVFLHSGTGGAQNYGRYNNPVMDKLLDDARVEPDQAKRKALYSQVAELTQKDLPISYIYTTRYFAGLTSKVGGFKTSGGRHDPAARDHRRAMKGLRGRMLQLLPTLLLVSILVFGLQAVDAG